MIDTLASRLALLPQCEVGLCTRLVAPCQRGRKASHIQLFSAGRASLDGVTPESRREAGPSYTVKGAENRVSYE